MFSPKCESQKNVVISEGIFRFEVFYSPKFELQKKVVISEAEAIIIALKKRKIGARRGMELDNQQDVFKEAHSSIPNIMK